MEIILCDALPTIESKEIAFDIETTVRNGKNADPYTDRIISLQISDGKTVWILRNNFVSASFLLGNPEIKKLAHNASFDVKFLKHNLGIEITSLHDSLLCERLLNAGDDTKGNGLGDVLARRLGVFTDKTIRTQFMEHTGDMTEEQLQYAAKDVFYLSEIRRQQLEEISKAGMGKVLALENALVPVVADMELRGVGFDHELWNQHIQWLQDKKEEIKKRVCEYLKLPYSFSLFGGMDIEFNLNSDIQIKNKLHELGCNVPSTGESVLEYYRYDYDPDSIIYRFIIDVLEWRGHEKLLGFDYPKHVNKISGRLHCHWNQIKADTGRFSSSEPNMQQVPRPTEGQPNFRALFPPKEGHVYIIADYAQQEVRILAEISQDERLIEATAADDIYSAIGEAVFNHPVVKGSEERHHVKTAVLGDIYGGGANRLAAELRCSIEKANELKQRMRKAFPKTYAYLDSMGSKVTQRGFVTTLLGRRRLILDAIGAPKEESWRYINQAKNMPIQGTAADIGKKAMLKLSNWFKENDHNETGIVLAVHDELVVETPREYGDEMLYQVKGAMLSSMEEVCTHIKAEVDAGISERWTKV